MLMICCAVVAGAAVGWVGVPWASDWVLRRALQRADAWWTDSLGAYRVFKRKHPYREPLASAAGTEGALGLWRDEVLTAALAGALTDERLEILSGLGLHVTGLASSGPDEKRRACFSFQPHPGHRVFAAVVMGGVAATAVALSPNFLAAFALFICAFVMVVSVVCDMRARTIPLEACAVLALAGMVFQLTVQGLDGVLAGVAFALVVLVGVSAVNRVLRIRNPGEAVGRGDMRCMGSLSLATGAAAICGFAACYLLAAGGVLVGCALRRLSWGDGIPMAPFLSIWLVCGAVVTLMSP